MSFICIVCHDLLTNRPDGHNPGQVDVITTKCGHLYHLHCLMEWFRRKVDNSHSNHECPYCNSVVTPNDIQRIFPSEDEETEEIAAKFNEAKANSIDKQISQLQSQLEDTKAKFEEEQFAHENLKIEYALKLSEIEQQKRDHEVDLSLLDASQSSWKTMMDKVRKERNKIVKTMTTLEKRYAKQRAEMERDHRKKTEESQKMINELKTQNESLKKKMERLSSQQQQSFRPVFPQPSQPTPASMAPSQPHPIPMNTMPSSSSSSSRRRSAPNPPQPMLFCPAVSIATLNPTVNTYGNPSFRPSGSAQSHFLNPPNPAQNPFQNLLSATAAAAASSDSQSSSSSASTSSSAGASRSNHSNNGQGPSSSTSTSTSTNLPPSFSSSGHSSSSSSSEGRSHGHHNANFHHHHSHHHHLQPSFLPHMAHMQPHPNHPPTMHLSSHYPSYFSSSRNHPYPPPPYSFTHPPHHHMERSSGNSGGSSSSSTNNAGGSSSSSNNGHGNSSREQGSSNNNNIGSSGSSSSGGGRSSRILPAHSALQFYMQTAAANSMGEPTVPGSFPSFLSPTLHQAPLSPRH